jgi:hypothetical protein
LPVTGGKGPAQKRFRRIADSGRCQVIFLVIGAKQRAELLAKRAPLSPTFYLRPAFGEKDLEPFGAYLVQDSVGGLKQR